MVLFHVGVVRAFSRDGKPVDKVRVRVAWERLREILDWARRRPGIVAVEAEVFEGERRVGDPLMILAVAGDFRENVIAVLSETLNRIKAEVTKKEEVGAEG
jgi:molybdopterin synthase catalytic subunit